VDANSCTSEHVDQSAADAGDQRITGGESDHPPPGQLAEQRRERLAQRSRPRQPLLTRNAWDQIKVSRAPQQHFGVLDRCPQPLGKVAPSPGGQSDHLDHPSDNMPAV